MLLSNMSNASKKHSYEIMNVQKNNKTVIKHIDNYKVILSIDNNFRKFYFLGEIYKLICISIQIADVTSKLTQIAICFIEINHQ